MATLKEDALEMVGLLQAAHAAGDTPELVAVHEKARAILYFHGAAAGLTSDDIAEIDNAGTDAAARGGNPKPKPE